MIDLGWAAATKMPAMGLRAREINTVFITHCHADHVMGLPQLIMFRSSFQSNPPTESLDIVGIAGRVEAVAEAALRYATVMRGLAPPVRVISLAPGDKYENKDYVIATCASLHSTIGLCLRVTDRKSDAVIAFSGDTSYNPDFVALAHKADLLVHEATLGAQMPAGDADGHAGGAEAARVAKEAQVGQLLLTHMPRARRLPGLTGALPYFPATSLVDDGDVVEVVHGFQGN
jgi:ribonuclease BN (tRNA processing enzyme)